MHVERVYAYCGIIPYQEAEKLAKEDRKGRYFMRKGLFWVLLLVGFVLIVNLSRSVYDMVARGAVLKETNDTLARAKEENEKLKKEYENTTSNFFIEQQARDKLNMARSEETVLIVPTVPAPTATPTPEPPKQNWELWREALRL